MNRFGDNNIVDSITKSFVSNHSTTLKGIGDDAAVIDCGNRYMLISTDLLLEGIHFNLVYFPLKHLGYKAVIRAISDIYAMNGTPEQITISIGFSGKFPLSAIEELYEGIRTACERYNIDLIGGDTTGSLTGLTIGVTAIGYVEKERVIYRSGAQSNDIICVTGDLGAAYMGLQLLERERKLYEEDHSIQPDLSSAEYIIERQLKPEIPISTLQILSDKGILPTAMIDITNGLASDVMQICKASQKGCRIYTKRIPVDYETERFANEFNLDALVPALNGGEDFELLFTAPVADHNKLSEIENITIIGYVSEESDGLHLIGDGDSAVTLSAPGWGDTLS